MKIQKRQEIEFFGTKTGNANSIALGYATETKNFGEVAVGVMNKSTAAKDPNSPKGVCVDSDATLFSVGCGGSGERKNALEVKGDGSVLISGEDGDINVADKIKQALDTDASIELVKSADSDLQYTLMVNNESRGSINIPKDQFLKNVTYDTEAKQLVFTFVTLDEEEHVEKISINDLKDVYTAGNGININDNVISGDFEYIWAVMSGQIGQIYGPEFESVYQAISDEKTQRETTDNEIKSTLDTKADKTSLPTKLSDLENDAVDITINKGESSKRPLRITCKDGDVHRSILKYWLPNENSGVGLLTLTSFDENEGYFSQVNIRGAGKNDDGQYVIQVQDVTDMKLHRITTMATDGFFCIDYENNTRSSFTTDMLSFYTNRDGGTVKQLQLTVNKDGITKKDGKATEVFAADGTLFDLTTKADTSAIPTKTSQLTNDANFITSYTETDPVWTSEKGNYYTKTEIDGKGYLTEHQSLADYAKNTDLNELESDMSNTLVTTLINYAKLTDIPNVSTKADLVDGKLKADQLPKLDNIAAATTTEDMITKFNALLTDMKAKGYMTADITA